MRHRSRRRRAEEARDRAELARSHAEDELGRTRAAYDQALADGGVVLLQQVSADVDGFHVSMSMAQVLGWDPLSFLSPGVLRSMVHPDDLSTFAVVFPSPGQSPNPQLPPMPVIDLTGTASTPITPQSQRVDDELIVRFRTAHGAWAQSAGASCSTQPCRGGSARLADRRHRRRTDPHALASLRRDGRARPGCVRGSGVRRP
ncbi:MAG: hypothetical protein V9E94_09405 [Microthrixaceae bacterium]